MVSLHVSLCYGFGPIFQACMTPISNMLDVMRSFAGAMCLIDDNDMPFRIHMSRYTRKSQKLGQTISRHVVSHINHLQDYFL